MLPLIQLYQLNFLRIVQELMQLLAQRIVDHVSITPF